MTGEYTEIQVLPTGIYRVNYKRLTPSQLKALRTRTKTKLRKLRREHSYHVDKAREIGFEVEGLERLHEECVKPEVEAFVERWQAQKAEADARAEEFLKEFLGVEGYAEFRRQGWLQVEDRNGDTWRIHADGETFKWMDGRLERVCILRNRGLPLPDHIISVVTSIRERPESYAR